MNKMKKTLSLILTIVFVISLSAFNVQAEETDGISGATAPVVEETPDNSEVPGDEAAAEEEVGETATAMVIISLD